MILKRKPSYVLQSFYFIDGSHDVTLATKQAATMRIEIRSVDHPLDEMVAGHVERRLRFALGRFESVVERVTVRLRDVHRFGDRISIGFAGSKWLSGLANESAARRVE